VNSVSLSKRLVLIGYCLWLAFCFVWIPWCENYPGNYHGHNYRRIGYGWVFAGPRVVVDEPDPSSFKPVQSQSDNASGFTVLGEESTRRAVQSGLVNAEPDVRLIALRFIVVTALASAAFLGVGVAEKKRAS
jgi:hypothetical protein